MDRANEEAKNVQLRFLGYVAIAEAVSFLLLLMAMGFKYGMDEPNGVEIMGPIHGMLFLAFVGLTLVAAASLRWRWQQTAVVLASAVIPIGGYVVGHRLLRDADAAS